MLEYFPREPWPWQARCFLDTNKFFDNGGRRLCVTGPTGSGKSTSMMAQIKQAVDRHQKVTLLTNRTLLAEQLYRDLCDSEIDAGIVGANFKKYANDGAPVQLCMTPTIQRRILAKRDSEVAQGMLPLEAFNTYALPPADLCIIDEPHMNAGATTGRIVSDYMHYGGNVIGYTATPMGLTHLFDELVVAGTTSECRKHGALVPAVVYCCEEFDCRRIKGKGAGGDLTAQQRRGLWSPAIFSYIYKNWRRTNPDGRMSLGFGPGVDESVWLAEHFTTPEKWITEQNEIAKRQRAAEWEVAACEEWYKHGVRAAHIDGTDVWLDGKRYKADMEARKDVIAQWRDKQIAMMWNRWVLREGIDVPELYHLTLAAVIGSLQSFLQIVGRVIRASKETPDGVVINDHGANCWRHGSPNEDRDWAELWRTKPSSVSQMVTDQYKRGEREEPITCPKCRMMRRAGSKCPKCGHEHQKSSRLVIQTDGVLQEYTGKSVHDVRTMQHDNTQSLWDRMYWPAAKAHSKAEADLADLKSRADKGDALAAATYDAKAQALEGKLNKAQTFSQLYGLFFIQHGYFPPRDLANMPKKTIDWYAKVRDINGDSLYWSSRSGG